MFYNTLQECEGIGDICVNQYSHMRTIHLDLQINQTLHVHIVHREEDITTSFLALVFYFMFLEPYTPFVHGNLPSAIKFSQDNSFVFDVSKL